MQESEARGLTHWMLYSDGSSVYAYDIVTGDGTASAVLSDLPNQVETLAVDSNKGYMFVGYSEEEIGRIDRYQFTIDAKEKMRPSMAVNATSVLNVYEG